LRWLKVSLSASDSGPASFDWQSAGGEGSLSLSGRSDAKVVSTGAAGGSSAWAKLTATSRQTHAATRIIPLRVRAVLKERWCFLAAAKGSLSSVKMSDSWSQLFLEPDCCLGADGGLDDTG
jgi:hypothetical protein